MGETHHHIFIHGLEGSSQGFKAQFLRARFPHIHTPDFQGPLETRMEQLTSYLGSTTGWVIVGSSFGGLMATLFAHQHPHQVRKLILLAPALTRPFFTDNPPDPFDTPTVIYHGQADTVVPLEPVRRIAEQVFRTMTFHSVNEDHSLHQTVQSLDWEALLYD